MKKICHPLLVLFFFIPPVLFSAQDLLPEHKEWLEVVSPIMTKTEREIFLKLKSSQERERFVQFFWRQRDPHPDTIENEFYKEFMERVRFADQNFGHGTSKRGCLTERGYFYLILGPPLERHFFTTHSQVWPLELWFYQGEVQFGLPAYFYLIFYQPQGLGEYRLYYPGVEGPEKLVVPSLYGQTQNRNVAVQVIKKISAELAGASLSYLPGDSTFGMASFSSDTIISSARSLAERKFSDAYARSYLSYKGYVETESSHSFTESDFKVKVFKNNRQSFIHWTLEPKKINFALDSAGLYYAAFELVLKVEDSQGSAVFEKEEEIPLKITGEQYKAHQKQLFAFQDILPIIPGNFKLFLLLKNKTAGDFSSFNTDIVVPQEEAGLCLSNLLLYPRKEKASESQKNSLQAFAFGGTQYLVSAQNNFPPQTEIGIYLQVYNLGVRNSDASLQVEILPSDSSAPPLSYKKTLKDVLAPDEEGIDFGPLSTSSLKPGYYQAKVTLIDKSGAELGLAKENFILLSQPYSVLPWTFSKLYPFFPHPEQLYILSTQLFMTKKYGAARERLEQALKMKDEPRIRILLAKTLYALNRFQDSLTIVIPVYEKSRPSEAAKIIALDYAGLKDWSSALVYLEKLMEQATEASVINLAAECYLNLNQPEKALPLIQKSLEINPAQPYLKELEEKARKMLKK